MGVFTCCFIEFHWFVIYFHWRIFVFDWMSLIFIERNRFQFTSLFIDLNSCSCMVDWLSLFVIVFFLIVLYWYSLIFDWLLLMSIDVWVLHIFSLLFISVNLFLIGVHWSSSIFNWFPLYLHRLSCFCSYMKLSGCHTFSIDFYH